MSETKVTKAIETDEQLELARTFVKLNKYGRPQCKQCLGKGYRVLHTPLPNLKQISRVLGFNVKAEFCDKKGCSFDTYSKAVSGKFEPESETP